jgi:hypothetical protein
MRSAMTLILSLTMAVAAIGLALASPGRDERLAAVELERASGAVSIANSMDAQALFAAEAMRPGQGVSGTVTIGNAGDVAGTFTVQAAGVQDTPGAFAGKLSERVELVLFDVTDVHSPKTKFAGHPADFASVDLGAFAPGEERHYLFAATLPDGGDGDNRFQGSGMSLGFEWRATTVVTPPATPTATVTPKTTPPVKPKATPTPTPTATPTPPVALADALGMPPATTCIRGGKLKFKLKGPDGSKVVSATVAVGRKKLRLKGSKVRKAVTLKRLRKSAKVKVTVKASNKRTYSASRKYRACGRR